MGQLAQLELVLGAFEAGGDVRLAATCFAQLGLQFDDVGLKTVECVVKHFDLDLEPLGHVASLLLFNKGRLGQIFAVLGQCQLGLFHPARLQRIELGDVAAHFLLIGDGAGGGGANLDQRFFHLENDHADHLRRVFRLVEQVGHIGGDDVAGPREDTHD